MGRGGVLVDSRGTLDINRKLAMSISITRNSQYTLRGRNDLSHIYIYIDICVRGHDILMNYFK